MKAVFIADPHIKAHPEDNEVIAKHLANLDQSDWLILVGDLTDNGIAEEYKEALRLLAPWKDQCLLVPGNHDCDGLHGFRWSPQAAARWAKFVEEMEAVGDFRIGDWYVCGLDSVNAESDLLDFAQGCLGEAELNRAREAIKQARKHGLKVCLTLHHNPCDNPRMEIGRPLTDIEDKVLNWAEKLQDSSEFLEVAYGGEGADLIICGHTHIHMAWTATDGVKTRMIALGDFRASEDCFILDWDTKE